jgi:hypothetical protein
VRLGIGVVGTEEGAGQLIGSRLDGVDVFADGVQAVAGRAFGVLVAQPVAHRQQHRRAGEVLAGDQLEVTALIRQLLNDGASHRRVDTSDEVQSGGEPRRLQRDVIDGHPESRELGLQQPADSHGGLLALQWPRRSARLDGRSPVVQFHLTTPVTTSATAYRVTR